MGLQHTARPEIVDFAGVVAGVRALDMGCGPGALPLSLHNDLGRRAMWRQTR
jgi:ubiquinone/menaquinone biosynthesis C-methylase UbiE